MGSFFSLHCLKTEKLSFINHENGVEGFDFSTYNGQVNVENNPFASGWKQMGDLFFPARFLM